MCSLHQLQFAQTYADRIVGLVRGRLVVDVDAGAFDAAFAEKLYGNAELQGMID